MELNELENEESRITIKFEMVDEFGSRYTSSTERPVLESLGETTLDLIGEQLNTFLKQVGYIRGGDYILMESLTEDERDALYEYLCEYRTERTCNCCKES